MNAACADADGIGLRSDAKAAEIDIVTARGEIGAGIEAQGDIVVAAGAESPPPDSDPFNVRSFYGNPSGFVKSGAV